MTTVVSAVVGPVMSRYLDELGARLRARRHHRRGRGDGFRGDVMGAARAAAPRCATVESGGAAGVSPPARRARRWAPGEVISSTWAAPPPRRASSRDGRPGITHDFQVGGKGSFGGTRAGPASRSSSRWSTWPRSARAGQHRHRRRRHPPGRTPFGRRRSRARLLRPRRHRADRHRRRPRARLPRPRRTRRRRDAVAERAAAALETRGGRVLWVSTSSTPRDAVHDIVNAAMAAAIRVVTVQRGIDPATSCSSASAARARCT